MKYVSRKQAFHLFVPSVSIPIPKDPEIILQQFQILESRHCSHFFGRTIVQDFFSLSNNVTMDPLQSHI